jgi:hypothetical protein
MSIGGDVFRQATLGCSVLTLAIAAPAMAQRPTSPEEQQFRYQVQRFEVVLVAAVRQGGDAFAQKQADVIPPGVQLTSNDPQVKGLAPPQGGGLLFYVQVPEIRVMVNDLLIQRMPRSRPSNADPIQPTGAGSGRPATTQAQGLPSADPMTVSPVADDGRCERRVKPSRGYPNPDYEYAVAVCDALMDAMLENAGSLPIKENEWLTVAAVNGQPDPPGLVNSSTGYTTYLAIKGSDLQAYRQGKMSKEEARKLVEMNQR